MSSEFILCQHTTKASNKFKISEHNEEKGGVRQTHVILYQNLHKLHIKAILYKSELQISPKTL